MLLEKCQAMNLMDCNCSGVIASRFLAKQSLTFMFLGDCFVERPKVVTRNDRCNEWALESEKSAQAALAT